MPLLPVRRKPDHKSEMVNQLLFGEAIEILEQSKDWLEIQSIHDRYKGWIEDKPEYFFASNRSMQAGIVMDPFAEVRLYLNKCHIPFGSIWDPSWGTMLHGRCLSMALTIDDGLSLLKENFLGAPYLWGGRSVWGIDCSGLVQLFGRIMGVDLPRDAKDQAFDGEEVLFGNWKPGDIAFLSNNQGNLVNHVGIVYQDASILHASGTVRLDTLDSTGIFTNSQKKYSHRLLLVRRIKWRE